MKNVYAFSGLIGTPGRVPRWLPAMLVFLAPFFMAADLAAFQADDRVITGTVRDVEGEPLIGVNVVVQNTSIGTVTDIDGAYSLDVPEDATTLIFSYTGYAPQEVTIGNSSTIDVIMDEGVNLEEVVVVGYGTQRKVDVTGAVSSLSSDKITNQPFTNPDQALGGQVAGVHIANRSGDPGAPINVRIRGVGTPGNNQPLWVIDGVPIVQTSNITVNTSSTTETNPLAGINPNDIESIDVLKDASATAIYGARAANGVIIVTTKRGKEGRVNVTYDGFYGNQQVPEAKHHDVLGVADYIDLQSELGRDFSEFSGEDFVDWQDEVFRQGTMNSHNLSVSGGTENLTFNVSGGYLDQSGVELGQSFERYSLKVNSDLKAGRFFRFGESVLVSSIDRLVQSEGGIFSAHNSSLNAPYYEIYNPDGPLGFNPENDFVAGQGARRTNYVLRNQLEVSETRINAKKVLGSVYGEFTPFEGLSYRLTAGVDYNVGDAFYYTGPVDLSGLGNAAQTLLVQSRPIELTTNLTHTLTYTNNFGRFDLTALVGYEETNFRFDKVRLQGRDLFNTNIRLASVSSVVAAGNEADHWALRGLLGRVNMSFDRRYLFTFNIRRDESSRFSEENRAGIFPSFSVGWRLSEEPFMENATWLDEFKLRGSWGQSGNQFTGQNFAYLPSLATTIFYVIGTGQDIVRGPAPVTFANSNLSWETSTQLNFGVDLSMWQGRFNMTFEYFDKTTEDVLLSLPIPSTSGYFLPAEANVGEIKNNGIELSLNYQNSLGELNYGFGGNLTVVNNEVQSLGDIPQIITGIGGGQTHRTVVGQSMGHFYGYLTDGIFQNQAEVDAAVPDALSSGRAPGDIRFVDVNDDGVIDAGDRTYMGSPIPGFYYGINGSLGWRGFDFSFLLQGVGDIQVYNESRIGLEAMTSGNNQSTRVLDRWDGEGSSNEIPRAIQTDPNGNNRYSDRWIEDADFLRIRNIQLGYTPPADWLERTTGGFVSSVRAYIGIQNLAVFTGYLGFEPEVTRDQSYQKGEFPLATGQDGGASPQPRIIQLGWQVVF